MRSLIVATALGVLAVVGCQNPDEFYRFGTSGSAGSGTPGVAGDTGAGGDPTGAAGAAGGPTGTAGTTGIAGSGAAGTTGVAGSGPAGTTGAAGTTGIAGSDAGGRGGGAAGSGAAGAAGGRGGTSGSGAAGAGGRGGAAGGGAAGRGGAAGGTAGRGAGGTAGRGPDRIQVVAKCGQEASSTSAISVTIKIYNLEASDKQWGDIKVRYYFTSDGMAPVVEFDYLGNPLWNMDKSNVVVTPTGSYVEIGFKAATAGTLFAFDNIGGSGDMQMRIHPADYHAMWNPSQADDPSFMACAGTSFMPRMGIAGFYMGQLAWGTTP